MTTIYECDITGKQYTEEDMVKAVSLGDCHGLYHKFEFGPDATIDEVRDKLHELVDEFEPFHQEWWDEYSDKYVPPRIERITIDGKKCEITVPTVVIP